MELREATVHCTIEELDNIIEFLIQVRDEHKPYGNDGTCHTHYRDWDRSWTDEQSDFIVIT